MSATTKWENLFPYIGKVSSLVKNSKNLQRDFLNLVTKSTLEYLREVTPKSSGTTANAWRVERRTNKSVTIGNSNEGILLLIQKGHVGGRLVQPSRAKAFHFMIDGQEFFRTTIVTRTQNPNQFMSVVNKGLDMFLKVLMEALIQKYWVIFKKTAPNPKTIRLRNITKQSAIGQGTKRSKNRGRGGGFKVRTGKKSFKRRLGRRRRSGKFITSKKVEMK